MHWSSILKYQKATITELLMVTRIMSALIKEIKAKANNKVQNLNILMKLSPMMRIAALSS